MGDIGPDYILDIGGLKSPQGSDSPEEDAPGMHGRKWLAVRWKCCGVYSRVYRNREGTAYAGRCPKCLKAVEVKIGPGGTDARFFEAS